MPITIQMPALSPTMEVGNLVKWLKQEGDTIESGEVIAEIETDKALMEFESADEGVLAKILVKEGTEGVKVNEPIAIILLDGENAADIETQDEKNSSNNLPNNDSNIENKEKDEELENKEKDEELDNKEKDEELDNKEKDEELDNKEKDEELDNKEKDEELDNKEKDEEKIKKIIDVHPQNKQVDDKANKSFISPLAKRLADSNNIDIKLIKGSGPNGRIIKKDIQLKIDSGSNVMPIKNNIEQISNYYDPSNYSVEKVDNIRTIISTRLQESNLSIPSYSINIDASITNLNKSRANMNNDLTKNESRISINHFLIKITSLALINTPQVNTTWMGDSILKHTNTDIGLAVSLDNGLITPIIRNVQSKALREIRDDANELILRAREKKLSPDEYQGGTISISNLGSYGIKSFTSIINPPQSSILSIGSSRNVPAVKDSAITIDDVVSVTLTADHRLIDGAIAAEFLSYMKQLIENPDLMHL